MAGLVGVRAQAMCSVYMPVGPLLTRATGAPLRLGALRSMVWLRPSALPPRLRPRLYMGDSSDCRRRSRALRPKFPTITRGSAQCLHSYVCLSACFEQGAPLIPGDPGDLRQGALLTPGNPSDLGRLPGLEDAAARNARIRQEGSEGQACHGWMMGRCVHRIWETGGCAGRDGLMLAHHVQRGLSGCSDIVCAHGGLLLGV